MKRIVITCTLGCLIAAGGCGQKARQDSVAALDVEIVRMYYRDSQEQAVIRQHTLYPYHFRHGSASLTELGQRDVDVLARAYSYAGGPITVRRGEESEALYALRIAAVLDAMNSRGVERELIVIENDLPDGDGFSSENVQRFREGQEKRGFIDAVTPSG